MPLSNKVTPLVQLTIDHTEDDGYYLHLDNGDLRGTISVSTGSPMIQELLEQANVETQRKKIHSLMSFKIIQNQDGFWLDVFMNGVNIVAIPLKDFGATAEEVLINSSGDGKFVSEYLEKF